MAHFALAERPKRHGTHQEGQELEHADDGNNGKVHFDPSSPGMRRDGMRRREVSEPLFEDGVALPPAALTMDPPSLDFSDPMAMCGAMRGYGLEEMSSEKSLEERRDEH